MINEQNPQIEVAHTREEMLHILESLRLEACQIEDIYVIAKDPSKFDGVKWDANVKTHEVGNWVDQIKSWFTGESAVKKDLSDLILRKVKQLTMLISLNRVLSYYSLSIQLNL